MGALEIIGGVLLLIVSIVLTLVVLMQNTDTDGIGALMGGADSGSKTKTGDQLLNRITRYCAIAFFALALAIWIINIL